MLSALAARNRYGLYGWGRFDKVFPQNMGTQGSPDAIFATIVNGS